MMIVMIITNIIIMIRKIMMKVMVMNLNIRSGVARAGSAGQDCRVALSYLSSIVIVIMDNKWLDEFV